MNHEGPRNDWQNSTLRVATGDAPVASTLSLSGSVLAVERLVVFGAMQRGWFRTAALTLTHAFQARTSRCCPPPP